VKRAQRRGWKRITRSDLDGLDVVDLVVFVADVRYSDPAELLEERAASGHEA
jgi:hypothetical protein